jgi:hypothetical protein
LLGEEGIAVSFYPSRCRIVYPEWIFGGNRRVSIAGTVGGEEIYEGEMSTAYTAATKQVADNYNSIVDSREKRAGGPKAHSKAVAAAKKVAGKSLPDELTDTSDAFVFCEETYQNDRDATKVAELCLLGIRRQGGVAASAASSKDAIPSSC